MKPEASYCVDIFFSRQFFFFVEAFYTGVCVCVWVA